MKLLNNILVAIIYFNILTLIPNIESLNLPIKNLLLGDIIDINNLTAQSNVWYGSVFKSVDIDNVIFTNGRNLKTINNTMIVRKEICLDSMSAVRHHFPNIFVDGEKFSKNIFNTELFRILFFNKNWHYISYEYSFGVIKVCVNVRRYDMKNKMIEKNKTSNIYDSKYYISDVLEGRCITQIFVNNKSVCNKTNAEELFFSSALSKTLVMGSNDNIYTDKILNEYFNGERNLYSFITYPLKNRTDVFNNLNMEDYIDIHFSPLPKLIEFPESHKKSLIYSELQPGDIINVDELIKFDDSLLKVKSLPVEKRNYSTVPRTSLSFKNCSLEQNLKKQGDDSSEVDLLKPIWKLRKFGMNNTHDLNTHACLEVLLCNSINYNELTKSIKVINARKEDKGPYEVPIGKEDIIVRTETGNATHYIKNVKKGGCLFQASIFPLEYLNTIVDFSDPDYLLNSLIYSGEIISANNNRTLENWVKDLLPSIGKSLSLLSLQKNNTLLKSIWRELGYNEAPIGLQLQPLN